MSWTGFDDGGWAKPDNFAGAGPAESVAQLADSITRAGEGDFAEIGLNALATGLDVLSLVMDPLGTFATAGIGWLIEHVSFLREPLDWLAGNGDKIKAAVASWNATAKTLADVATEQRTAVDNQVRGWEKSAADGFRQSQGALAGEIDAMSKTCIAVAGDISTAGTITAAIRGMIRDLISLFVWEVIRNAAIALATSWCSFGASVAAFAAWTVGRGAVVLGKITQMIAKVMRAVTKILGRLKGLFSKVGDMLKGLGRFGRAGRGGAPNAPHARTPDSPATPPRNAGDSTSTSAANTPDAPSTPRADKVENAGRRMEDWGNTRPSWADVTTKGKEFREQFGKNYGDAGNTWKRVYSDKVDNAVNKVPGAEQARKAVDAYTPYSPRTRPDGTVSPHSSPNAVGFPVKAGADFSREFAKQDELENEMPKTWSETDKKAFEQWKGTL
ncbi:hypothetical protein FKR81_24025 [Lentzea tibetensis]|uniref:Outer membrane channel protein CpnT-like N-terminal domain-containing protein n=1 Tax=Lentzea tibetensis TaxID=2591470 RepID=A0A563EQS8_9PSEU|nr:hypothetical protein [Lentzea tibetensis]TWP49598.1 hypothetical protein FKR81_24025 [Lentzea tibetensis]